MKSKRRLGTQNRSGRSVPEIFKYFLTTAILALSLALMPGTVIYAQEAGGGEEYNLDWLGGTGNNTFDELTNTVQETGNSMYKLVMAVGVVGVLLAVVICGLLIAVGTNANKRSEHIGHLVMIMVGGILIFGAVAIVGMLQTIGGNIG